MSNTASASDLNDQRLKHRSNRRRVMWVALSVAVLLGLGATWADRLRDRAFLWGLAMPQWIDAALIVLAGIAAVLAAFSYYDTRPLPDTKIDPPSAPQTETGQAWRKPTGLRILERLKDDVAEIEKTIYAEHQNSVEAYDVIPRAIGYADYRSAQTALAFSELQKHALSESLFRLYERIERIHSGDVDIEIVDISAQIEMLDRERGEDTWKLSTWDGPCGIQHKGPKEIEDCERTRAEMRDQIRQQIKEKDFRLIELKADLNQLQNYDFRQLWQDAGLRFPATENITRTSTEALRSFKEKVEILNSIPDLATRQPGTPVRQPSIQEQIDDQQAHIRQLESDRDEELASLSGGERFEGLATQIQDRYMEADNSWERKIETEREKLRELKQTRRAAR